jgi:hypothetical protein
MELINATKMEAGYTMAVQPDGRELLVVVVKGTFTIPEPGREPMLAEKQVPLVMTDVFTGEPGFSAPLYEIDYAPRKPRCDVLLNGSAYAPGGRPAERVRVSLRVGSLTKAFDVVGNRVWQPGLLSTSPSKPEPFAVMPISYNNAFGGVDKTDDQPPKESWYPLNHAGVGYHEGRSAKQLEGKRVSNTEEPGHPIANPKGKYRPMAFGPIGRAWQPRIALAGTYDKKWLDHKFPFLPDDFREAYYQAAPGDQQMDFPQGGEEVELVNLTPAGLLAFRLPAMNVPFEFYYKNGDRKKARGTVDTLVLEPDSGRFMLSWRRCLPLRRNLFEIRRVVAGSMPRRWYREEGLARRKRQFSSLAELVVWHRAKGRRR